jgi:hypothetical protein
VEINSKSTGGQISVRHFLTGEARENTMCLPEETFDYTAAH